MESHDCRKWSNVSGIGSGRRLLHKLCRLKDGQELKTYEGFEMMCCTLNCWDLSAINWRNSKVLLVNLNGSLGNASCTCSQKSRCRVGDTGHSNSNNRLENVWSLMPGNFFWPHTFEWIEYKCFFPKIAWLPDIFWGWVICATIVYNCLGSTESTHWMLEVEIWQEMFWVWKPAARKTNILSQPAMAAKIPQAQYCYLYFRCLYHGDDLNLISLLMLSSSAVKSAQPMFHDYSQ
jgi:hypothetical protein